MEVAAELAMAERDMTALRLESEPAGSIIDELDGQRAVWHDVLPLLDAAATELSLGDLLHGEGFHLQEAMSALEMGDPQMDSMASAAPEDEPAPSLPPETISAADLVGVLDDMLCCEHAWYASRAGSHVTTASDARLGEARLRARRSAAWRDLPTTIGMSRVPPAESCATSRITART